MAKGLEIVVRPDGSVQIEGTGYAGAECEKATRPFREVLGGEVKVGRTSDWYRQPRATQKQ